MLAQRSFCEYNSLSIFEGSVIKSDSGLVTSSTTLSSGYTTDRVLMSYKALFCMFSFHRQQDPYLLFLHGACDFFRSVDPVRNCRTYSAAIHQCSIEYRIIVESSHRHWTKKGGRSPMFPWHLVCFDFTHLYVHN